MQCSWFYLGRGWTGALKLKQHAIWFTIWHTSYNSYLPFALHAIFTYLPTNIIPPTTQFPSTMRLADIKDCLKTLSVLVLALNSCWEITSHFNCQISLAHPGGCWPPTPSPYFEVLQLTCKFPFLCLAKGPLMRSGNEYWKGQNGERKLRDVWCCCAACLKTIWYNKSYFHFQAFKVSCCIWRSVS